MSAVRGEVRSDEEDCVVNAWDPTTARSRRLRIEMGDFILNLSGVLVCIVVRVCFVVVNGLSESNEEPNE